MGNENLTKSKKDKTLMIIIGVLSAVLIVLFVFFLVEKKGKQGKYDCYYSRKRGIAARID